MPLRIKNRSRRLLTVELNTRESTHLAPDEVSRPLEDYEVKENRQLEKLVARGELEKLADDNVLSTDAGARKKSARNTVGD